jgi:hypothetical protein
MPRARARTNKRELFYLEVVIYQSSKGLYSGLSNYILENRTPMGIQKHCVDVTSAVRCVAVSHPAETGQRAVESGAKR